MTSGGNNFNYFPENRTSLMLHFLPYAIFFSVQRGRGHGPSVPMVNTPLMMMLRMMRMMMMMLMTFDDDVDVEVVQEEEKEEIDDGTRQRGRPNNT